MPKYRNKTKKALGPYDAGSKQQDNGEQNTSTNKSSRKDVTNRPKEGTTDIESNVSSPVVQHSSNDEGEILNCDVCTESVEQLIQCDRCLIWFCCTCAKIPTRMLEALYEFSALHWFCCRCDKIAINAIKSFNDQSPRTSDVTSCITEAISTAMNSLKLSLQETINNLQNASHAAPTLTSVVSETPTMDVESPSLSPGLLPKPKSLTVHDISQAVSSCMSEEKEKQKRKLNLIMHNVPESSSTEGQQRKQDDIVKVREIFANTLQVTSKVTNAVRLGKKGEKTRLLKITVDSEKDKASILRNAMKLRSCDSPDHLKKIFITPDMTPKEREENKNLRAKLSELNKDGNNYRIKNGQIVRRSQ